MRKVIGIGETILDILFQDGQPVAAVPGGSTFNSLVSLSRLGIKVAFISEIGQDAVGGIIQEFLKENGMMDDHIVQYEDTKSPVSLAFLSKTADAQYSFYKNYPDERLVDVDLPDIQKDDVVMIGSYYSITPALRSKHLELLTMAKERGAIIYYDPNFRKPHRSEAIKLAPYILENLEYADIVRGSMDDFTNLYDMTDGDRIYRDKISFYCKNFIYTRGAEAIQLYTPDLRKSYEVEQIDVVSTVGAGDNFNAGFIYGLIHYGIRLEDIPVLREEQWDLLIESGKQLSCQVCLSLENYISKAFAQEFSKG